MKKLFLILLFVFNILILNNVRAEERVSCLRENTEFFNKLKKYGIYNKDCKEHLDRYSVIEGIEYYDFDNNLKNDGVIVVLDTLTDNVINIFRELKKIHFPVAKMNPFIGGKIVNVLPFGLFGLTRVIENDEIDNLTSSFFCRKIEHTDILSLHSYGIAIDLNILQNPCVFIDQENQVIQNVSPKKGVLYLNRSFNRKGKEELDIGKVNDEVVEIFKKYGYDIWGGYWDYPIDYQHFQFSTRSFSKLLMHANKEDAKFIADIHVKCVNLLDKSLIEIAEEKEINLFKKYIENRDEFFKEIKSWCKVNKKNFVVKNRK